MSAPTAAEQGRERAKGGSKRGKAGAIRTVYFWRMCTGCAHAGQGPARMVPRAAAGFPPLLMCQHLPAAAAAAAALPRPPCLPCPGPSLPRFLGVYRRCSARMVSGKVEQPGGMISDESQAQGYVLMCVAYPQSDCSMRVIPEVRRRPRTQGGGGRGGAQGG